MAHPLLLTQSGTPPEYIDSNFSAFTYVGNGSTQTINNGINLLGTPTAIGTDVLSKFSATTYTGNGSTQTITTGQDLAGSGGLVWTKSRTDAANHRLHDTVRGVGQSLAANLTNGNINLSPYGVTAFGSTGFSVSDNAGTYDINKSASNYIAWTFRRATRFFDVVAFTGNGSLSRVLSHSLGVMPGIIMIKRTDIASDWATLCRGTDSLYYFMALNLTNAASGYGGSGTPTTYGLTTSGFDVGKIFNQDPNYPTNGANVNGGTYIAYLFAHDTASDGMVQCGVISGGGATATLGWEPQFAICKRVEDTEPWEMYDSSRGWASSGTSQQLLANSSAAETTTANPDPAIRPTATGLQSNGGASGTFIYLAIRKPEYTGGGGLVWQKSRSLANAHFLTDTVRGNTAVLQSAATSASVTVTDNITSFGTSGFSIGANGSVNTNASTNVAWTFARKAKFFDVVSYTGNGSTASATLSHSLNQEPGMIILKSLSASQWFVYHRSLGSGNYLMLNQTGATTAIAAAFPSVTSTTFQTTSNNASFGVNDNGVQYIAYLFAHDTGTDGLIQCGTYTVDGASVGTVNLGWEPQFIIHKMVSNTDNWWITDSSRGLLGGANVISQRLFANTADAEGGKNIQVTATGFTDRGNNPGNVGIYLAIRRPNKPPTSGTQVYNGVLNTGSGGGAPVSLSAGFAADLWIGISRTRFGYDHSVISDRLRGAYPYLRSNTTNAESDGGGYFLGSFTMDGAVLGPLSNSGWNSAGVNSINWFFKRAPGVFSISCDTGTGSNKTESHNLVAVPEMLIRKGRSGATQWEVYFAALGNTQKLVLNSTAAAVTDTTAWNSTTPTSSTFSVGTGANVNTASATYVTYQIASLGGISKIGSYIGNGTSQTIDCGFSAGARFVLIKSSSTTGNWVVMDSVRGIVSGADPYLLLNSTAAEVTSEDCIDPAGVGFIVNSTTIALNTNGVTYQFWAIA